jgi:hypothetical protein
MSPTHPSFYESRFDDVTMQLYLWVVNGSNLTIQLIWIVQSKFNGCDWKQCETLEK